MSGKVCKQKAEGNSAFREGKRDACEEAPLRMHELFCLRQKSRGRVSGRCPDPAEAPPLHPAKGLRPFRNPFWGSLVYARALLPAAKIAWVASGRCPDPAEAPSLHPAKGLRPFRNPFWGSLVYARALLPAAKIAWVVTGRCPDSAEAPPLYPAKGLRPFRNPSWGVSSPDWVHPAR